MRAVRIICLTSVLVTGIQFNLVASSRDAMKITVSNALAASNPPSFSLHPARSPTLMNLTASARNRSQNCLKAPGRSKWFRKKNFSGGFEGPYFSVKIGSTAPETPVIHM